MRARSPHRIGQGFTPAREPIPQRPRLGGYREEVRDTMRLEAGRHAAGRKGAARRDDSPGAREQRGEDQVHVARFAESQAATAIVSLEVYLLRSTEGTLLLLVRYIIYHKRNFNGSGWTSRCL